MNIVLPNKTGGLLGYAEELRAAIGPSTCRLTFLDRSTKLEGESLFLQYSGYGFANRGAPLWLLKTLRRDRGRIGRLGVYFHELYASKPPWSSAFWLSPVQRHIVRALVEESDYWITSCSSYHDWLSRRGANKPNALMPMFSTIGEPKAIAKKSKRAIVFGTPAVRGETYRAFKSSLEEWVSQEVIDVIDVGAPIRDVATSLILKRCNVKQYGRQPAEIVSSLLAESQYGLLSYDTQRLAKSSVFAAYAAHAVCPVISSKNALAVDGLSPGIQYQFGLPTSMTSDRDSLEIGKAAQSWYLPHGIAQHVDCIASLGSRE